MQGSITKAQLIAFKLMAYIIMCQTSIAGIPYQKIEGVKGFDVNVYR